MPTNEAEDINRIQDSINESISIYLQQAWPYLADIANTKMQYIGVATPEAVNKYIPELEGELKPHLEDFGVGNVAGTLGGQKGSSLLYSLGGRLNILDLISHEMGHRAAELNPEWYKTFNAWQYPQGLDRELTISGYLTAPSYERMRTASEANREVLIGLGKEPISRLSPTELSLLDQLAKEEFFLRRAQYDQTMGSGPTSYMDTVEKGPNFLGNYVETLPEEDRQVMDYIANRYKEFLKYGPSEK